MSMISLIIVSAATISAFAAARGLSGSGFLRLLACATAIAAGAEAYRENETAAAAFLAVSSVFTLIALRASRRARSAWEFAATGSDEADDEPWPMLDGEDLVTFEEAPGGPPRLVRMDDFEDLFRPGLDEALDTMYSIDVEVQLADGSQWKASFVPAAEAERRMEHGPGTMQVHGGGLRSNLAAVKTAAIDHKVRAARQLLQSGGFSPVFESFDA